MTAITTAIGWITKALQWIDNIINLWEDRQAQFRFKYDAARVQLILGTDLPDGARKNKHYVKLELDFMHQWAGRIPAIEIAMMLGRPVNGVKRKTQRIESNGQ